MPIRVLDPLMISQIAAGEVVERPASVVKELVENALDAGATRISVEITDGGRELIRVADDGHGMPPEDLPLAVAPHATSKVARPGDLEAIGTFGFRGEALASIASVARVRLTSCQPGAASAWTLEAAGAEVSDPRPASARPGTSIEVRDLFFNTPARRKFLKSGPAEAGQCAETLERTALVNPQAGFSLLSAGRRVLDLPPGQSRRERALALVGQEGDRDAFHEFTDAAPESPGAPKVWGLAGHPSLARANSKGLHLCVNGRPVRDRSLQVAVREAYRGLMPPQQWPAAVVFLDLDPREVDVNVHPQKSEVRFRAPQPLFSLVLRAVRQALAPLAAEAPSFSLPSRDPTTTEGFVSAFRGMDERQRTLAFQEVKRALEQDQPLAAHPLLPLPTEVAEGAAPAYAPAAPAAPAVPAPAWTPAPVLRFRNAYLVTEDDDGLLIVDQHALHERVMFEDLRRRIEGDGGRLESQRLLLPEVIGASPSRQEALDALQPLLERLGIEAGVFGAGQIAIHAFPSLLVAKGVEAGAFMAELLDAAADGRLRVDSPTAFEQALAETLDMMACKAAVKAGDRLSTEEVNRLLARRLEIERSGNCPHGRPTTLRLSVRDLEKRFGRG